MKVLLVAACAIAVVKGLPFDPRAFTECKMRSPPSKDDIERMQKHQLPVSKDGKCMFACIMKQMNVMNSGGGIDINRITSWAQKKYSDEPEKIEKVKSIASECAAEVQELSDECEKAVRMVSCTSQKSRQQKLKKEGQ